MITRLMSVALCAITVAGCNPFEVVDHDAQSYASAVEVRKNSSMPFFPITAKNVKYYSEDYQDRYEYLYFEDNRSSVDEFSRSLIGTTPINIDKKFHWMTGGERITWWPKAAPTANRSGSENYDNHGDRRVLIIDERDRSKAWVFAAKHY